MLISAGLYGIVPTNRSEFIRERQAIMRADRDREARRMQLKKSAATSRKDYGYDVSYYNIDLQFIPEKAIIKGFVDINFLVSADSLRDIDVDFTANMVVDSISGAISTFNHTDDAISITLDSALQAGQPGSLRIYYHGSPQSGGFGAFGFDRHPDNSAPIIWSLSEPYYSHSWWPCKDLPNDKADSVSISLSVPTGLIAVSNGSLKSVVNDSIPGMDTYRWYEKYPICPYLVSVAISNYTSFSEWYHYTENDSMRIDYYVYPENLDIARAQLTETPQMLSVFSGMYGLYPFIDEKYGIAQFPWGGGMEHQTITSQGGFNIVLTVHELSHQWFGDKITTPNWKEIWLNEGFASYSEALYFEKTRGEDYFHSYMSWMTGPFAYPIFVDDTSSVNRIFDNTVYDKGAWVLHMLRHIVGDSTFFTILKDYQADPRFAYGNSSTAAFRDVCESHSDLDLHPFFNAWMNYPGRPEYDISWNMNPDGQSMHLRIRQLQARTSTVFPLPLDITLSGIYGDTLVTVMNDIADQSWDIPVSNAISGITVDENNWVLKTIASLTHISSDPTLPRTVELNQNSPNPFNGGTVISFNLPRNAAVRLLIFDVTGHLVDEISNGIIYERGQHILHWNGRSRSGTDLPSGIYFYRLQTPDSGVTSPAKKMLLIK